MGASHVVEVTRGTRRLKSLSEFDMDLSKGLLRYVAILLLFGSGVVVTLRIGAGLHSDQPVSEVSKAAAVSTASPEHTAKASNHIASALWTNLRHPVSL